MTKKTSKITIAKRAFKMGVDILDQLKRGQAPDIEAVSDAMYAMQHADNLLTHPGDRAASSKKYNNTIRGQMARKYATWQRYRRDAAAALKLAKQYPTAENMAKAKQRYALAKKQEGGYELMYQEVQAKRGKYENAAEEDVEMATQRWNEHHQSKFADQAGPEDVNK